MIVYVDASALVPVMKLEHSTPEVASYLDQLVSDGHLLVAGRLLETEMRRTAVRQGIDQTTASAALAPINIVDHTAGDFQTASSFAFASLGTLDALHLATALRIPADLIVTLDTRLATAAEASGIPVLDTSIPRTFVT